MVRKCARAEPLDPTTDMEEAKAQECQGKPSPLATGEAEVQAQAEAQVDQVKAMWPPPNVTPQVLALHNLTCIA